MLSGRLRITVQAVPHSRILAACQAGPAPAPFISGTVANSEVSEARPQRMTLRAFRDGVGDRLVAHHADDVRRAVDDLLADRRRRVERGDAPFAQAAFEVFLVLLAAHQRHAEFQFFLAGDLQRDVAHPVHAVIAAGEAAGAHDQRHAELVAAFHHQAQVALGAGAGEMRLAGAEMGGSGIGGAAVAGDDIGFQRDAAGKRGFQEAGADLARMPTTLSLRSFCFPPWRALRA